MTRVGLVVVMGFTVLANEKLDGSQLSTLNPQLMAERIVFLGDSITDGHTHPLLIQQAMTEAVRRAPVCINAGVGGDTANKMRQRLERDVLAHRPTLVTLSAGINDAMSGVPPAEYEANVVAIAERLRGEKIPLLILTTSIVGPKHAEAEKILTEYNAILRRVAERNGYRLAAVNEQMQEARASGQDVLEEDQVHPNYEGQRILARAVLDALGHKDLPVPKELKVDLMPGVIRTWKLRAVVDSEPPLDEASVAALQPDASWNDYSLPEADTAATWWLDQERKRGFAVCLEKRIGASRAYQGIALVEASKPRSVFFNTGAQLQTVWLNGKRIYQSAGWTGWHAEKERVAASLQAGRNVVVIETAGAFFLSVTEQNDW